MGPRLNALEIAQLREKEAIQRSLQYESLRQIRLAGWPDWERAMPTAIIRSALFSPIAHGNRRRLVEQIIDSSPGVQLTYSGDQLDMADADVFMHVLEMAKHQPLGARFVVNRARFLAEIGRAYHCANDQGYVRTRSVGERQYIWLNESLERLRTGSLKFLISQGEKRKGVGGVLNLISTWFWDDERNCYEIAVEPEIEKLFQCFSRIYVQKHLALPKKDQLAKWMHWYVAGCGKNTLTKIRLAILQQYSGNGHRRIDHFETSMRRALLALADVEVIGSNWFIREPDRMVGFTRIV